MSCEHDVEEDNYCNCQFKFEIIIFQYLLNVSDEDWKCDVIELFLIENNLPIHSLGYISLKTKIMKDSLGFDGQTRTFHFDFYSMKIPTL